MFSTLKEQTEALLKDYPEEPRVYDLLWVVADNSNTEEAIALGKTLLDSPASDDVKERARQLIADKEYEVEYEAARKTALALADQGNDAMIAELEKQARALLKTHPDRVKPYELLELVAENSQREKALKLATEIGEKSDDNELKERAYWLLMNHDPIGRKLTLAFDSLDNKRINFAELRGKVILLDFWATTSEPCMQTLPVLKQAYETFHSRGFEIVGINMDTKVDDIDRVLRVEGIKWPQYFDGKKEDNLIAKRLGIEYIPARWLLDKNGVIRDIDPMDDLSTKIENLLKETTEEPVAIKDK